MKGRNDSNLKNVDHAPCRQCVLRLTSVRLTGCTLTAMTGDR